VHVGIMLMALVFVAVLVMITYACIVLDVTNTPSLLGRNKHNISVTDIRMQNFDFS
jgi:hypothetical protein